MNTKVEDFYVSCLTSEKQALVNLLIEDGLLNNEIFKKQNLNLSDEIYTDSLNVLKNRRHQLTLQEEEYINSLAKKFKYI